MFPHHENEIAQSVSANNKKLANVFMHSEHLLVDERKMSKSLNNFYTLEDVIKQGIDPISFRLLVLQSHYRSQLNFTWKSLEASQVFLNRLRAWADLKFQPQLGHREDASRAYSKALDLIKQALNDDLNTGQALAIIADLVSTSEQVGVDTVKIQPVLEQINRLLGIDLAARTDIDKKSKDIIAAREAARDNQEWSKADQLRVNLQEQGIEINDTPHGPVWSRN
jgi:cysteinyl-tRNA synthetase